MNRVRILASTLSLFLFIIMVWEGTVLLQWFKNRQYQQLVTDQSLVNALEQHNDQLVEQFAVEHGLGFQNIVKGKVVTTHSIYTVPFDLVLISEAEAQGVISEDVQTMLGHLEPYLRLTRSGVYEIIPFFQTNSENGYILYKRIVP